MGERAELLALVRLVRSELPEGRSFLRELVVRLERRLEAPARDGETETA